ncbi:hypothetical protein Calab_0760 [Caldithrix abyssi DSM 13497]|uniref:Uncharacterized protein n=1 Tax=Caldithrix abyssi DSM 13497 TaxID=880073 RepID=H1XTG6_CALAY|nr:MarR family transcriptional regulator [Caldithrix abyssi]APF16962.1 hypothetical protein Cabys_211 [Caldithrix abyssi DSM 13497]EHO40399.1 hypothetical protein Calab_0760 [Caldithrix abyssi DSM 13497]
MPILKNPKMVNQSEIARKLGITPAYVHMLLTGKRSSEKYEKAIKELINRELRGKAA